jgi:hypothetical protein
MFDSKIQNIAIFMCSGDCEWQLFEVADEEFKHYETLWAKRLEQFYNL